MEEDVILQGEISSLSILEAPPPVHIPASTPAGTPAGTLAQSPLRIFKADQSIKARESKPSTGPVKRKKKKKKKTMKMLGWYFLHTQNPDCQEVKWIIIQR